MRKTSAGDITYTYGGQGRRVGKAVNGTLVQGFMYANGINPIAQLDGLGNVVATFVYGTRPNVPDLMLKGGVTFRIISNELGSPVEVVNVSTGAIVEQVSYDAWGNITSDTNPGFQPFGFAVGLYDSDTGLVHFGARDYDQVTGRWTTRDPLSFGGGDTNLFGYVLQDPVDLTDESGLYWEYSQSTGDLYYVNNQTGATNLVSKGYSGAFGPGLNNSAMESVANVGPITRGKWLIGAPHDETGSLGPYVMNLTPEKGTNTLGKTLFSMHGDKLSGPPFHASHCCTILGPAISHEILNSGDHELVVTR